MSTLLSFCQWLAETPFSTGIRESTYVYPIIESVHVLSLCVFVGLLLSWDLQAARHHAASCRRVGSLGATHPMDHDGRRVDGAQRIAALRL